MKTNPSHIAAVAASALFFLAAPMIVAGDTPTSAEEVLQQEEARQAVKAGLVRPLEEVLTEAR